MTNYAHGYRFENGDVLQDCPNFAGIDYNNLISVYNFEIGAEIDYDDILVNSAPPLRKVETHRVFGIDVESEINVNTPGMKGIDDHAPIMVNTQKHNVINGSSPRFSQVWRDDNGTS